MYIKKLLLLITLLGTLNATGLPKSYYKINDTKQKTTAFFNHLYPMIVLSNNKILKERAFVESYFKNNTLKDTINSNDHAKILKLAKKYKIKQTNNLKEYLDKINTVPPSMALAQSAVESNWGKSRFTKQANNIFGVWTYKGKGLVPLRRKAGEKHKIKIYNSLQGSLEGYMNLLNKGTAYKKFRRVRKAQEQSKGELTGLALSQTMIHYSGIGEKYLKILRSLIRKYDLKRFDTQYYKKVS
ncbi:MAG: glucosaminidase domain-containing protein [Campylobacterota bacterium]|nr:glucosaminidase domain-containing protein [Campylobacterota bacterium]